MALSVSLPSPVHVVLEALMDFEQIADLGISSRAIEWASTCSVFVAQEALEGKAPAQPAPAGELLYQGWVT
jgi:hypothetical protein